MFRPLALIVCTLAAPARSQQPAPRGAYEVAEERSFSGRIGRVIDKEVGPQHLPMTFVVLKGGRGNPVFVLGPKAFVAGLGMRLGAGDDATFVGVSRPGKKRDHVMVRQVTVGGKTFALRNEKGMPLWRDVAAALDPDDAP